MVGAVRRKKATRTSGNFSGLGGSFRSILLGINWCSRANWIYSPAPFLQNIKVLPGPGNRMSAQTDLPLPSHSPAISRELLCWLLLQWTVVLLWMVLKFRDSSISDGTAPSLTFLEYIFLIAVENLWSLFFYFDWLYHHPSRWFLLISAESPNQV